MNQRILFDPISECLYVQLIDKALFSMFGSMGELFFTCKGIFHIEKQGLAMRLGEGGGAAAGRDTISLL